MWHFLTLEEHAVFDQLLSELVSKLTMQSSEVLQRIDRMLSRPQTNNSWIVQNLYACLFNEIPDSKSTIKRVFVG